MIFTEEFDTPNDFIVLQLDDFEKILDSYKVVSLEIAGEPVALKARSAIFTTI
jgi:hypothetical protein